MVERISSRIQKDRKHPLPDFLGNGYNSAPSLIPKTMTEPEYAPQYTGHERLTHTLRYGLPVLILMIVMEWWLFPWI